MANWRAIVVGECRFNRDRVARALAGLECDFWFSPIGSAVLEVSRLNPDIVIVSAGDGYPCRELECLRQLRSTFSHANFVFIASVSSEDLAIAAFHAGAQRYLRDPWTLPTLLSAVVELLPIAASSSDADGLVGGERLIGCSPAIRRLRAQIRRIAPAKSNVLILGETGTGKELVAELIHLNGSRAGKPLMLLNTAAIPDSLLENELFGHERGAFTGATNSQDGKLTAARSGTVFLDEIGDLSPPLQAKLLRAIEGKSVYRLGGTQSIQLDVRIIAATNHDLEQSMTQGRFRKDLYYRLNVVRIDLPPLRERAEDIPRLIGHYLTLFNRELGRSVRGLSAKAMERLCEYQWPGNIRELRNLIEALMVHLSPGVSGFVDIPPDMIRRLGQAEGSATCERDRLLNALIATNWNKSKAASQLHWSRMTLYRKIHRYHLVRERQTGAEQSAASLL
jgi:DNA-binding NtrC family response regulator